MEIGGKTYPLQHFAPDIYTFFFLCALVLVSMSTSVLPPLQSVHLCVTCNPSLSQMFLMYKDPSDSVSVSVSLFAPLLESLCELLC